MRTPIRIRVFDAGRRFGRHDAAIRGVVADAILHVRGRSALSDVDIVIQPLDFGEHEIGVAGVTMGPNNVHIGIEIARLDDEEFDVELLRVAVHELHHALRWRHLMSRWTVAEVVAMEGLAVLADQGAAGGQDDMDRPFDDEAAAMRHVASIAGESLVGHRAWIYTTEPGQPGGAARVYRLGVLLMRAALREGGLDPWSAARLPAADLVAAGLARVGRGTT